MTVNADRQVQAKKYARINRRLMVIDLALGGFYVLVWLFSGISPGLKTALGRISDNPWFLVAGFGAVLGGIYFIINLPLSYYQGFILPHRFDMSTQTVRGWITDEARGLMVGAVLGGVMLEVIYAVLRRFPDTWWLIAAGLLLLFNVLMANLAPILLMPLFYKSSPLGDEYADLAQRLLNLANRAHKRVTGVYKIDMSRRTKAANAAVVGLGNTRRIVIGDTLLNEFTPEEIETVMAHELGHQVHMDIPLGILVETLITLAGLYLAGLGLHYGVTAFGFTGPGDVVSMPLLLLVIGIYGFLTMPLSNAFSRWRERRADEYALQMTRRGEAFASALARLADQNLSDADPEPWVEFLLYSHPALGKRIKMAETYK
jgi:STE24 endopeptidase